MSIRLQVILNAREYWELKRAVRSRQMSIAERIRQALDQAHRRKPMVKVGKEPEVIRAAARLDHPTGDIDRMLAEIEMGYGSDANP
jgi:hypothetical protein